MLTSGEPSFQAQHLPTIRSASGGLKQQFWGAWFLAVVCDLPFPSRKRSCAMGMVPGSSQVWFPPPSSAFAVSCSPARQGVQSEEVVFYLEGKTWTQSEILAHFTVISSHRPALFHGLRQKSTFPFDIDVEISRTPPACREIWFGAFILLLPFIDWLVVCIRSFLGQAFKCSLDFWTLNSTDWIYSHCVKGAWAVTALNAIDLSLVPVRLQHSELTGSCPSAHCISTCWFSHLISPRSWALPFPTVGGASDYAFIHILSASPWLRGSCQEIKLPFQSIQKLYHFSYVCLCVGFFCKFLYIIILIFWDLDTLFETKKV